MKEKARERRYTTLTNYSIECCDMELTYEVIIDTKQAKVATEEIEDYFNDLSKSADKTVKRVAEFGGMLVEEMKQGKMSTKEMTESISALQLEIKRRIAEEKELGQEERNQLKHTQVELNNLQRKINEIDIVGRKNHAQELQRKKAEEMAIRKKAALEESALKKKMRMEEVARQQQKRADEAEMRRQNRLNTRMGIASSRRMGMAIKSAGGSIGAMGGMVSSMAGMAKFGVVGVGIAGAIEALKKFAENFGDSIKKAIVPRSIEKDFADAVENFKKAVNYLIKKVLEGKSDKDASLEALSESIERRRANIREEQVEQEKRVARIHEENLDIKQLKDAIAELRRIPAFAGLTNEQFVKGNKEQQIKAVRDYYIQREANVSNTEIDKEIDKINKLYDSKIRALKLTVIPTQLIDEFENLKYKGLSGLTGSNISETAKEGYVKLPDRLIKAIYSESFDDMESEWNRERLERFKENTPFYSEELVKKMEAQLVKVNNYYDSLTEAQKEDSRIMRDINAKRNAELAPLFALKEEKKAQIVSDNELARYTENANKAKEAQEKINKALKSLQGIAPAEVGTPMYATALVKANEEYKREQEELKKLKNLVGNTEEWKRADERSKNKYKQAVDEANEAVKELFDEIDSQFNETSENSLQRALRNIKEETDEMRKAVKKMLGEDVAEGIVEEQLNKIGTIQQRKEEDAIVAYRIEKIEKETEAKIHAIEVDKKLETEEARNKAIEEATIESIKKKIDAMKEQNHLTEEEKDAIAELERELDKLVKKNEEVVESMTKLQRASMWLDTISNSFSGSANGYMQAIGGAMGSISGAIASIPVDANGKAKKWADMSKSERGQMASNAVSATVQFGLDTWEAFSESAKQSEEALKEWNQVVSDSAHRLAMLELEKWEYKQRNIFGIDDPYNKLASSIRKESAAQREAAKALAKMANEGIVQTGTKKKVQGQGVAQLVGSGAAAGAAIGSAAGSAAGGIGAVPGALIGGAIGAVTGLVTGLFASRERVAVYDSLKNKYSNIYDADTLEINKQILADYDKMDDATKRLIDNAKELLEVQKEAREEYEQTVAEMVGDMGNQISNVLLQAFRNDEIFDAMDDIKDYMANTIGDILHKQAFSAVFGDTFDSLQRELNNIYDPQGNRVGDIGEIVGSYYNIIDKGLIDYNNLMKAFQDKFNGYGYNLFQGDTTTQEALQGAISGMSEETAGKINGNFMGLKLATMNIADTVAGIRSIIGESNSIANNSLNAMLEIAENTAYCRKLDNLASDIAYIRSNGLTVR